MKHIQSRRHHNGLLAAMLLASLSVPALAADGTSDMYNGMSAVFVKFANAGKNADLKNSPQISIGFHATAPRAFTLDTGSTGIVVSQDLFTPGPGDKAAGEEGGGQLTYSSSGQVNHGTWYQTQVRIYDGNTQVALAEVPVLRVTSLTCLKTARRCTPTSSPKGISMMGVGFSREHDQQKQSKPAKNPFLHLTSVSAGASQQKIRRGYIITQTGVYLGLTPAITKDFAFIKLALSADIPGEWSPAPATIEVNGVAAAGSLLMDTGVPSMFLRPPEDTSQVPPKPVLVPAQPVPNGTEVKIYMPEKMPHGTPQPAFYTFTVGSPGNVLRPEKVTVVGGKAPFVNTGRNFLKGFEYLYDADGGYVGFKWTGGAKAEFGGVVPSK